MSDFDEAMGEAFDEAAEFFGTTAFTFRGANLAALVNELRADEKLAIGGAMPNVTQTLMFAQQAFTPAPRTGEYVTLGGRRRRIGLVESDETTWTFYLESPEE